MVAHGHYGDVYRLAAQIKTVSHIDAVRMADVDPLAQRSVQVPDKQSAVGISAFVRADDQAF